MEDGKGVFYISFKWWLYGAYLCYVAVADI